MLSKTNVSFLFPLSIVFIEIGTYLANDMYLPGLPSLGNDLQITQDLAQYTLLVWFLGQASMQLIAGPMSDKFGRKIIILLGCILFFFASCVCAMTSDIVTMLIARFLQGTTVGIVVVPGYAAIHERFDTNTAIKIIAVMGAITILAPALGPLAGAIVIELSHWRIIFWILSLWGAISALMIFYCMPETNSDPIAFNIKAILRDYVAIAFRLEVLKFMLPLGLLLFSLICWIIESPFIIIETLGKSGIEYGFIQLMTFGCFLVGTQLTHVLIEKVTPHKTIVVGLSIAFFSVFLILASTILKINNLYWFVGIVMIFSMGSAITFGPLNRLAIEACEEPMGRRTAIANVYLALFGVLAVAMVTAVNDKSIENLAHLMSYAIVAAITIFSVLSVKTKSSN